MFRFTGVSAARMRAAHLILAALALALCPSPLLAVAIITGNGNTDAQSLQDAGGPAVASAGFANVGRSSTTNASVTYLGDRWVLTAGHVAISSGVGQVSFGANYYTVDDASIVYLHNPEDNSLADLKLFRITTDPGLPSITAQLLNSAAPTGRQIIIGNGLNVVTDGNGAAIQQYWQDDGSTNPWPDDPTPEVAGPNDYSGFDLTYPRAIRWGENDVSSVPVPLIDSTHVYKTTFDDAIYTGIASLASEAQGTSGDSGGGVFSYVDGQWKLTGIMLGLDEVYPRQHYTAQLGYFPTFGNETVIADLRFYRDEILSIVPEPGGLVVALTAGLVFPWLVRRRRR